MELTVLRPAQELELSARAPRAPVPPPGFLISRDLKCFHCGFVAGQFIVEPDEPRRKHILRVSGHCPSEVVIHGGQMRCCRCGGPVYLDEVEMQAIISPEALEKPRRGRKPKLRPAV